MSPHGENAFCRITFVSTMLTQQNWEIWYRWSHTIQTSMRMRSTTTCTSAWWGQLRMATSKSLTCGSKVMAFRTTPLSSARRQRCWWSWFLAGHQHFGFKLSTDATGNRVLGGDANRSLSFELAQMLLDLTEFPSLLFSTLMPHTSSTGFLSCPYTVSCLYLCYDIIYDIITVCYDIMYDNW